jgi:hypothetical protein
MSARLRHAKRAGAAWMQVKTDWGNAKQLPRSIWRAVKLEIRKRRLARIAAIREQFYSNCKHSQADGGSEHA